MSAPAVTLADGSQVTADMSPLEVHNAVSKSVGARAIERPHSPPQFHTAATIQRMQQGDAEEARALSGRSLSGQAATDALTAWFNGLPPAEQSGLQGPYAQASRAIQQGGWLERTANGELIAHASDEPQAGVHPGRTPPSPQELEASNAKLAQFDDEMRAKGFQLPAPVEDGRFQRDERTGIVVDTAALEQCHKLFRELAPKEREDARGEYEATLAEIYAGKLQLADMEGTDAPRVEQPREPNGRFAAQPSAEPGWQSHVEDGEWVPLEHLTTNDTSGYTIPQYIQGQRVNVSTFELLRQAKAAGISQDQVNAVLHQQAVGMGWVRA